MKPHKNVKIKLNDNMLPHYRIARKLQAQCLFSDGESGAKVEPWLKIHFYKSQIIHSRNQHMCRILESQMLFHQPQINLCIETSQGQNCGYRSRATRVHPKSQSWLNQRKYIFLRKSLLALAREYIRVSWSSFLLNFVCLFVLVKLLFLKMVVYSYF